MILRDRTAIHRSDISRPIRAILKDNLLARDEHLFDYGCGFGDDLDQLCRLGFSVYGWDPLHRPYGTKKNADVVNLGFVINVIERPDERADVLRDAWRHATRLLVVAARLRTEEDPRFLPFEDGWLTGLNTFQKFYDQRELHDWIRETLSEPPIAAAPGIFYIFRYASEREAFVASRYRRVAAAPLIQRSDALFEQHRAALEPLMQFISNRGRLPEKDEIPDAHELWVTFKTPRAAFRVVRNVTGEEQWESIRNQRKEDLLVYIALGRFPRRPQFTSLPEALQRDIRSLFGSYKNACNEGDNLLFRAGHMGDIDSGCKAASFGKLMPTSLYVHAEAVHRLPSVLRVFEGCARVLTGDIEGTTIVKLRRHEPKISYLAYPTFNSCAHPELAGSVRVDLKTLDLKYRDFRQAPDPPILHRKEDFVPSDYPNREIFAALTRAEEEAGLFDNPGQIGLRSGWDSICKRHRATVMQHVLVTDLGE